MLHIVKSELDSTSNQLTRKGITLKVIDSVHLPVTNNNVAGIPLEKQQQLFSKFQKEIDQKQFYTFRKPSQYLPVMLMSGEEETEIIESTFDLLYSVDKNKKKTDDVPSTPQQGLVEFNPSKQQRLVAQLLDSVASDNGVKKEPEEQQQDKHNEEVIKEKKPSSSIYILLKNKDVDEEIKRTATFTTKHSSTAAEILQQQQELLAKQHAQQQYIDLFGDDDDEGGLF